MTQLGNGLFAVGRHEESLSVKEAELAIKRRLGASEDDLLISQANLAVTYHRLGRFEDAIRIEQDVYSVRLKLNGEEHRDTLGAATNYANLLIHLKRFEEARSLLRKTIPVARRVFGEGYELTLILRWNYALALNRDDGATLDDLRESVETLEAVAKSWKRVYGDLHPETRNVQSALATARNKLVHAAAGRVQGAAVN